MVERYNRLLENAIHLKMYALNMITTMISTNTEDAVVALQFKFEPMDINNFPLASGYTLYKIPD